MRPVLHGDVSCAARALRAVPQGRRAALCRKMIREAEAADRYRLRHSRLHPRWGNGSLMAVARHRAMAEEPGFDDIDYCRCFIMVLEALALRPLSVRRSPHNG